MIDKGAFFSHITHTAADSVKTSRSKSKPRSNENLGKSWIMIKIKQFIELRSYFCVRFMYWGKWIPKIQLTKKNCKTGLQKKSVTKEST